MISAPDLWSLDPKMRSGYGYGYGGKTINLCQNNILTPKIPSVFASKLPELDLVEIKHHTQLQQPQQQNESIKLMRRSIIKVPICVS